MNLKLLSPGFRRLAIITAVTLCVLIAVAARAFPPLGHELKGVFPTLGRFHPILLHAPVTLLPLALVMEIVAAWKRPQWRETAGFVLGLGALSVIGATGAGIALAATGGYSGEAVSAHLLGGVLTTCFAVAAWILLSFDAKGLRRIGLLALFATQGLLVWTAHIGGNLSHGADFLVGAMPPAWRDRLGLVSAAPVEDPKDAADPVFVSTIRPMLRESCVECHGPDKANGKLRLDSLAFIAQGGEVGRTVVAGAPTRSELLLRLQLPATHEKAMPPAGKKRLTPEQTDAVSKWIAGMKPIAGAAPAGGVDEAIDHYFGEPPAARLSGLQDYSSKTKDIVAFTDGTGAFLGPVSALKTDGLTLGIRSCIIPFVDASFAKIAPVAGFVVTADLADGPLTDAGLAKPLAGMKALYHIDLTRTGAGKETLRVLAGLPSLEVLILNGTPVDDAALAELAKSKSLKTVYLAGSQVTPGGVAALRKALPRCKITADAPALETKPVPPPYKRPDPVAK